jgi:hypothetical protein
MQTANVLQKLERNDIFEARRESGAALTCIVVEVDTERILARRITTQEICEFSRSTGEELMRLDKSSGEIMSVEPLPLPIYQTLLSLDRRYRLSTTKYRLQLTDEETAALLFLSEFYSTHPWKKSKSEI